MNIMTILILVIIGLFVLMLCVTGYRNKYGTGGKVKMQLKDDETGRVTRTGIGNSYGSAALDLCSKLYSGATSTNISGIQDRIDSMNKIINEYRGRMKEDDLRACESYRDRLVMQLNDLKRQEEDRQKELQEQKRKIADERKQKQKEKEQTRIEKEKQMSEQKRYIAAQRRLMTDSLRYDVMHRDGFRCVLCGASPQTDPNIILHVDHILPLSKGGKTEMSNLRTLCERCNLGKRDKIENETTYTPERFIESEKKSDATEGKVTSDSGSKKHDKGPSKADILDLLNQTGVSYVDKRPAGGALWVVGGRELKNMMVQLKRKGFTFVYSEKGGRATKGQAAWWYRED